jgi:enoyl-CoA hydratase
MSDPIVTTELQDEVAVVRFDDGKANAFSPTSMTALNAALDQAEKEAKAVVIVGRPGRFSGGFDLSVMRAGDAAAVAQMVRSGAELAARLYEFPKPVVIACSGHAIAMGAVLLLSADVRIGAQGDFKIGLNEVTIGMTLPTFAVELANDRLSRRHLQRAAALAELYAPTDAVDAGFLDRVVAPEALLEEAVAEATRHAALDARAHHGTKQNLRAATVDRIRASLDTLGPALAGSGQVP